MASLLDRAFWKPAVLACSMLAISGGVFSQTGQYVSCPWADNSDYFVYELNDTAGSFSFMTTYDHGVDALSRVPHRENANYKEHVEIYSRSMVKHCRTDKRRDRSNCFSLNRVNGTLTHERTGWQPTVVSCKAGLPATKF